MKIEVLGIEELEDGGANMTVNLDDEAARAFIAKGILAVLREALNEKEEISPT
jgi:hypothetical protein